MPPCPPALNPTEGVVKPLKLPLPRDLPLPSPHIRNQLAPLRERAREPVVCFHSPLLQQGPQ